FFHSFALLAKAGLLAGGKNTPSGVLKRAGWSVLRFARRDWQLEALIAAQDAHSHRAADTAARQHALQIVDTGDRRAIERDDDVAHADPGQRRGRIAGQRFDACPALARKIEMANDAAEERQILRADTEVRAPHAS